MASVVALEGIQNSEVVRILEDFLEEARAGRIVAAALFGVNRDGGTRRALTWKNGSGGYLELLGAVERGVFRTMMETENEQD